MNSGLSYLITTVYGIEERVESFFLPFPNLLAVPRPSKTSDPLQRKYRVVHTVKLGYKELFGQRKIVH